MSIETIKEKIYEFNTIAGNLDGKITTKKLKQQIAVIQEELNETLDAVVDHDSTELVDGVCDLMVTVIGLYAMVEKLGHDVEGAALAICDQNLQKFPKYPNKDLVKKTQEYYFEQRIIAIDEICDKVKPKRHVIKNGDTGKILKPLGFAKIDLSEFVKI